MTILKTGRSRDLEQWAFPVSHKAPVVSPSSQTTCVRACAHACERLCVRRDPEVKHRILFEMSVSCIHLPHLIFPFVHSIPDSMWPAYMTESMPALAHCWYSMRGYTYASVLDFDEFIVPGEKDTIKDLLQVNAKFYIFTAIIPNHWKVVLGGFNRFW